MKGEPMPVTASVITWAREEAGISLQDARRQFSAITKWEAGTARPTYSQLERMADKFKVPVAVFFFPKPPDLPPIAQSFRTIPNEQFQSLPSRIRLLLRKAKGIQLDLAELMSDDVSSEHPILSRFESTPSEPIEKLAQEVRWELGISIEEQLGWKDISEAFESWRQLFFKASIYVFKDAFRDDKYSGFCLYDQSFPLIYVNNSCSKTRQVFTLFHELAHLLFRTSGIDSIEQDTAFKNSQLSHTSDAKRIEEMCNKFASNFLVPQSEFTRQLGTSSISEATASRLADRFHVSREMIYRRFFDMDYISREKYETSAKKWKNQKRQRQTDGGDYYRTIVSYLGREFMEIAWKKYYRNQIDESKLASYLNVKPSNLGKLEVYFQGGRP